MKFGESLKAMAALLLLGTGLGGCGVIYTSPSVSDGGVFGSPGTDLTVDVVPLTHETTLKANLTEYIPQRLPLGFQPDAVNGLTARMVGLPRLSTLPPAPSRPGIRPASIADRLPPFEAPVPYMIGIGDVLLIAADTSAASVDQLPALITAQSKRQGFIVQDDGAIAIPDAGRIRVAGMTMQDAEAEVFRALVAAGIDPTFSFEISEFNSQRVAVGGAVRTPTLVPITFKPLYLHEALAAAGGLLVEDPNVSKVQLFRNGNTYQISAERFLTDPTMRRLVLRDGDSIYVASEFEEERARARFSEEVQLRQQQIAEAQFASQALTAQGQALSNEIAKLDFSRQVFLDRLELGDVKRDYAYLTGEVRTPKRYELPFGRKAVLADVMHSERGLPIREADYGEIYVLRRSTDPAESKLVTAYHLDASNAVNLALTTMFEMHAGDVVFVTEQPVTTWNRVVSQIVPTVFLSAANVATNF